MLFPDLVFPKPFVPSGGPTFSYDIQAWGDPLWNLSLQTPFGMPNGGNYPIPIGEAGYMVITSWPGGIAGAFLVDGTNGQFNSVDPPLGLVNMLHIAYGRNPGSTGGVGYYDPTVATMQFIAEGDSMTAGSDATVQMIWTDQTFRLLSIPWKYFNVAVGGTTVAQMIVRAPTTTYPLFNPAQLRNVLVFWGGTNDNFFGADAATIISRLTTYFANAYAAATLAGVDLEIVAIPMAPRKEGAWSQATANTVNAWFFANAGIAFDRLANILSNSQIANPNPADGVYDFAPGSDDFTHMLDYGQGLVASIVAPQILA